MMKDLYSLHADERDFWRYYEEVKKAYLKIFKRIGFRVRVVEAAGGVFTDNNTHEFQVEADGGEDTIYVCSECDFAQNQEIFKGKEGDKCPSCKKGKIAKTKSIEVGNIFPFGTYYSERMKVYFADKNGAKKPVWFGSYGIGSTRVMGTWVESNHDERGIIWNKAIAPFAVHLIDLSGEGKDVYEKLTKAGVEVLWDDREASAGQKFSDADLIGIPVRLVISDKTKDKIEWKERASEKIELLSFNETVDRLGIISK